MTEAEEILINLQAVNGELFPLEMIVYEKPTLIV